MSLKNKSYIWLALLTCILILAGLLCSHFPNVVINAFSAVFQGQYKDSADAHIFFGLMLPGILAIWLVGLSLGMSGAVLQSFLRNPLADPGILGISSGSSFTAMGLMLLFDVSNVGQSWMALLFVLFALIGALGVILMLYGFVRLISHNISVTVILVGVALSTLFGALSMLLVTFSDNDKMRELVMWGMGGYLNASWLSVLFLGLIVVGVGLYFTKLFSSLNILALGEDTAVTMGINVRMLMLKIAACAGILIAFSTAMAGPIVFVGLVSPHIIRLLKGPGDQTFIPLSGLFGGVLMVSAYFVAHELAYPYLLPINVIMALIGVPFFIGLLWKKYR